MRRTIQMPEKVRQRWSLVVIVIAIITGAIVRFVAPSIEVASSLRSILPWLNRTDITIYYIDNSNGVLVPISHNVPTDISSDELLTKLTSPPTNGANLETLVDEHAINEFRVEQGNANLDLSSQYLESPSGIVGTSLILSMLTFPNINGVQITLDGNTWDDAQENISPLYFMRDDLIVAVPAAYSEPREALEAYMSPEFRGNLTGLPSDVELLSYSFNPANGLLALNFSYTSSLRSLAISEPDTMRGVLIGLIASMTNFTGVQAVTLDFEGHSQLGLGQCANLLRAPQTRPTILNDERLVSRYGSGL